MCLYPRLIANKKYSSTKKNGGNIPPVNDLRVLKVPIGCGKCMECKKQKARDWQVRLHEEIRQNNNGKFITLSFSNDALIEIENEHLKHKIKTGIKKTIILKNGNRRNYYNYEEKKTHHKLYGYDLDNALAKKAVRLFLERWRKEYGKSLKHWLVTELGQQNTERIHLHGIIFTNERTEKIQEIWYYGNIWIGDYVNERTVNYIVKYINKIDGLHREYNPKILTSPGIGNNYTKRIDSKANQYKGTKTNELYTTRQGLKLSLPIYYRNLIYTDEEKEKLWLNRLDKQVRYINGIKIDVSTNENMYYHILETQRLKNKRLGFGDDAINWQKRKYENELRELKKLERLRLSNNNWGKKR